MKLTRYNFNPCDMDRFKAIAPIGDALAFIWDTFTGGTECNCCLGTRLVVALAAALCLGLLL